MAATLPDYLRDGLALVSIGLNPSPLSVQTGVYFANPRNRFWRALALSGLVTEPLPPSPATMQRLLHEHGIGFTDVVKRPTAGGGALRAADFWRDAPLLAGKLYRHRPAVAWFHGRTAWSGYLRHVERSRPRGQWGLQPERIGRSLVYVTPNPSPANAHFSLDTLVQCYQGLARLLRGAR